MTSTTGETTTDRQSIADMFATFYEHLYKRRRHDDQPNHQEHPEHNANNTTSIPPFTMKELQKSIKELRNGRSRDTSGLLAEMLKAGGEALQKQLLQLYNDIAETNAPSPIQWNKNNSQHHPQIWQPQPTAQLPAHIHHPTVIQTVFQTTIQATGANSWPTPNTRPSRIPTQLFHKRPLILHHYSPWTISRMATRTMDCNSRFQKSLRHSWPRQTVALTRKPKCSKPIHTTP